MSQTWFERLLRPTEWAAAAALAALTALVFVSVATRYLLNWPLPDAFDFTRLLLCVSVFWGIAAACGRDDWVRADVIWEFLGPGARRWIDRFARALVFAFFVVLCWKAFAKVLDVRGTGESTSDTRTLLWPFLAVAWSATILALTGIVFHFLLAARGAPPPAASRRELAEPRP
jgi:TRAP-type C4-dicarboxylate transport system permease small subunit